MSAAQMTWIDQWSCMAHIRLVTLKQARVMTLASWLKFVIILPDTADEGT